MKSNANGSGVYCKIDSVIPHYPGKNQTLVLCFAAYIESEPMAGGVDSVEFLNFIQPLTFGHGIM